MEAIIDGRSNHEIYLDAIHSKMDDLTTKYFPKNFFKSRGGYSNLRFDKTLHQTNKYYRGSEFYYEGNLQFFHLTSISNLFSILNERALRFYNLDNSNDVAEYTFPAAQLRMTKEQIDRVKENLFTFSFCSMDDLNNENVWKMYGNNSKNVAIVFEIINEPELWENFQISSVKYQLSENIRNFFEEKIKLEETYPGTNIDIDFSNLICFYKEKSWIEDNEVRIMTYYPFDTDEKIQKYVKTEFKVTEERQRFTKYFKLPLWVDNDSAFVTRVNPELDRRRKLPQNYFIEKPAIKIKNIILGNNTNVEDKIKFIQVIEEMIRKNFGYKISIKPYKK